MADLRKDDRPPVDVESEAPEHVQKHPIFSGGRYGLMSADSPRFPVREPGGAPVLEERLRKEGLQFQPTVGMYDGPEKSYIIHNPSREQMLKLGHDFGQESVIWGAGGNHEFHYTNGPNEGQFVQGHPQQAVSFFTQRPQNFWTAMPDTEGFFRLNFDPEWKMRPRHELSAESIVKAELEIVDLVKAIPGESHVPHPHAYEWHDGHTDHYTGMLKADEHPHTSSYPKNDQAAGVGVKTYADVAAPYGSVAPGVKTNLLHYPLHGRSADTEAQAGRHGFQVYYAGGKYGKPDLARRNYNTGHLMVYDPTPASGGDFGQEDYTKAWRQQHELAHALTYPQLNQIYGEGRRIGKLGVHRNLREAQRAVHWEWLAAHKQRELAAEMGIHVPDETFHKELNTVMHDAVHRAVTGQFTEPSGEGFLPHAHKVPLETALGMVQAAGRNLGLQGPEDLLQRKMENMSLQNLKKALVARLKKTEADLIELAEREATVTKLKAPPVDPYLAKAEDAIAKMAEHTRQGIADREGYTHRWFRNLKKSEEVIGDAQSTDYRSARDAALKKMFVEGYKKSEAKFKKHGADGDPDGPGHMEPGVHENPAPGQESHMEPGGHEMAAMPMPDQAPQSPVGSSAAEAGVPSGTLTPSPMDQPAPIAADPQGQQPGADMCPLCGHPDVPGQCTCLPGQDQVAAPPAAESALAMGEDGMMPTGGAGAAPLAMSDKEPSSQPIASPTEMSMREETPGEEHSPEETSSPMPVGKSEMCKTCGYEHVPGQHKVKKADDYVANDGSRKSVGVVGKMPPKGSDTNTGGTKINGPESKEMSPAGSGDLPKTGNKKAEPPMAKPPSGKNMGTSVPVAKPAPAKVSGPAVPAAKQELDKAALPAAPKAQMAQHAQIAGSKPAAPPAAAAPGAAPMPSPAAHAARAQAHQSALQGAFQPKGPVHSGLELAPKKPAGMQAPTTAMRSPGAGAPMKSPFGKSEKCPFCKRSEHPGECAP